MTLEATAYYVFDVGLAGSGNNAVFMDAFDIGLGDFIGDDFVDVSPDNAMASLTSSANQLGYIDTSTPFPNGSPITITARKQFGTESFDHWEDLGRVSNNAQMPAKIGAPNPNDVVINQSDNVLAIAMYQRQSLTDRISTVPRGIPVIVVLGQPDGPVVVVPGSGGIPGGPLGPLSQTAIATLSLLNTAESMSGELRHRVVQLAAEQLRLLSEEVQRSRR